MKFEKKGLIFCPNGEEEWMQSSFMTPVPILIEGSNSSKDKIRIFGGIRDKDGVSRIGFIDVKASNPSEIIYVHKKPILDIGEKGCFDDNGMILGSLIKINNTWRLYYVGFQMVKNVKFYAFSGVATSENLFDFKRNFQTPIMDRKDWMKYIGAIHTVLHQNNKYKIWYSAGNDWKFIDNNYYPVYSTFYTESKDGINFNYNVNECIIQPNKNEYRIGRPTVFRVNDKYIMFCTRDTKYKEYGIAYFESNNGIDWERMDEKMKGLEKSPCGWDSEMVCYPNILSYKEKIYCFYNGNGMGKTGVGYAEIISGF